MTRSLSLTIILYALGVALICVVVALAGRPRPPAVTVALVIAEVAAAGQALVDGARLVGGRHGPEVAANVGYLVTSLIVLPVAVAAVRLDPGRWGSVAVAIGCLLLSVVSIRLHQTIGVPGAHA